MEQLSSDLRGKLSGAVGAYNAMSMLSSDPRDFERRVLAELDLEPSDHSTQLVEPEYLLRLLAETNVAFGIIANLADDLRNLQRSEIAEVRERFASSQVGSSTMPQKRNPWNSEHVKSLWKAFAPRLTSFYMDQISEHQRDLTNSASSRFVVDYLAGFVAAANRMKAVLAGLEVRTEKMAENLGRAGDLILAEPAYILGSIAGRSEAHEEIRRATLEAEKEGVPLLTALKRNPDLIASISEVFPPGSDPEAFFSDATAYTGLSSRRAREIADEWKERLSASEA
jgi:adenylosuccinate lyase